MHRLVLCGLIFATFAGAADLAGTWQNGQQGRGGQPSYFPVHIPGKGDSCSAPFRLSNLVDRVPEPAQKVDRPCPPNLGTGR